LKPGRALEAIGDLEPQVEELPQRPEIDALLVLDDLLQPEGNLLLTMSLKNYSPPPK
jgi:hypothetical protein